MISLEQLLTIDNHYNHNLEYVYCFLLQFTLDEQINVIHLICKKNKILNKNKSKYKVHINCLCATKYQKFYEYACDNSVSNTIAIDDIINFGRQVLSYNLVKKIKNMTLSWRTFMDLLPVIIRSPHHLRYTGNGLDIWQIIREEKPYTDVCNDICNFKTYKKIKFKNQILELPVIYQPKLSGLKIQICKIKNYFYYYNEFGVPLKCNLLTNNISDNFIVEVILVDSKYNHREFEPSEKIIIFIDILMWNSINLIEYNYKIRYQLLEKFCERFNFKIVPTSIQDIYYEAYCQMLPIKLPSWTSTLIKSNNLIYEKEYPLIRVDNFGTTLHTKIINKFEYIPTVGDVCINAKFKIHAFLTEFKDWYLFNGNFVFHQSLRLHLANSIVENLQKKIIIAVNNGVKVNWCVYQIYFNTISSDYKIFDIVRIFPCIEKSIQHCITLEQLKLLPN